MMQVATIDEDNAQQTQQTVEQAGRILSAGGLVVFPTETVYGVGAAVASDKGMDSLRVLKGRADTQPFSVHMPSAASAQRYIDMSSPVVTRLIERVLPGPVTLIVDVSDEVIEAKIQALNLACGDDVARSRLYHNNTIGLRCPDDPIAQQILGQVDGPVVASSANLRGDAPPHSAEQAKKAIGDKVDMVVDGGPTKYAKPSTIIRVGEGGVMDAIKVERAGVYDESYLRKRLQRTILMVCSGNTCRSPMAEGICKKILADERGITIAGLDEAGFNVISAGAFTMGGSPASEEAIEAMQKLGIDIRSHRSQQLNKDLIDQADVIYCMTQAHLGAVTQMSPDATDKTMLLDANGDIDDPIGAGTAVYQRCAEIIRRRLQQRLKELKL